MPSISSNGKHVGLRNLDARDVSHAVEPIPKHPGVTFGPWEIRPAADLGEMIRQSEARRAAAGELKG